ncbi:MAG TPA: asparagine synthase (glutamine-hydrolyzing) [Thermoanaerobaculia bacterium]|nr:asparagine synthase (glutamine-hydrolyzing) [Thermoanaerobaculia bacterium]
MCGIVTIFAYDHAAHGVDPDEIRTIRDSMRRRGPDGSGEWISGDGRVGMASRRLAIIDPSSAGNQPMRSADGDTVIVFNGEIYNHRELRARLEAKGASFHSRSDTEVLLHLYREKGSAMVHDLRGMFAFCIWDAHAQRMFIARDPYGIKPLYYAVGAGTIRIASQVKALIAGGSVSRAIDPAGAAGFFLLGSVPEPFTIHEAIKALPAGSWMWIDENGASSPVPYYSIADVFRNAVEASHSVGREDAVRAIRESLLESVRLHLVSDVPPGAFLSSGVDSTAIVALAREAGTESLATISLSFEEDRDDESAVAARTARHYGLPHTTRRVGRQELESDLPAILHAMDQPSIDGINTWFVAKAAAEQGLKVALSGLGGDELFGSYPSFRFVPRLARLLRLPGRIPLLGPAARRIYRAIPPLSRSTRLGPKSAGIIELGGSYEGAWLLRRGLFMPWEIPSVIDREMAYEGLQRLQPLAHIAQSLRPDPGTPFGRVAALESTLYLRNQLLRDADWASMAHSVEVRVPFVDPRLLEQLAPVVLATGPGAKRLVHTATSSSAPAVYDERKLGFQVPLDAWLGLEPQTTRGQTSRVWAQTVWRKQTDLPDQRILVLATDAFGGHGGIALYNRDLLQALCSWRRTSEVVVIPRHPKESTEPLPSRLTQITSGAPGKLRYARAVGRTILRDGRFDLVVCAHLNLLPLAWIAARANRTRPLALIFGIDAWSPVRTPLVRRLLHDVSAVVSISQCTSRRFLSWAPVTAPVHLLPNAIHLDRYSPGPKKRDLVSRYGLEGRTVVMTLGRMASEERYKGFDEVLDVLPRLAVKIPDVVYLACGDGADRERLQRKAETLGVSERVVFTGNVPEEEKADHYRLADVFAMPSRGEGFGFVLLEAMACGVPVIASSVDGGREAVMDGALGSVVDPGDPESLISAILEAVRKPHAVPPGLDHFSYPAFERRAHELLTTITTHRAEQDSDSVP